MFSYKLHNDERGSMMMLSILALRIVLTKRRPKFPKILDSHDLLEANDLSPTGPRTMSDHPEAVKTPPPV